MDPPESTLTYGELDRRARLVAARLQKHAAAGAPVLLCLPQGVDYVVALAGCLYAGAIAVPGYPPDPDRPKRTLPRLQAILDDAQARVVLVAREDEIAVRDLVARRLGAGGATVQTLPAGEEWSGADGVDPVPPASDTPAVIMYTSGSITVPKGVVLSHGNLTANIAGFAGYRGRACKGLVSWLPLFHDLGLLLGFLHPLQRGAPCVMMTPRAFAQRPLRWLELMSEFHATTTGGPNFAFDLCVRYSTPEERARLDLSAWTLALNGSESVRAFTQDAFCAAFGPCGFRPETFYPSYGLAESAGTVTGGTTFVPSMVRRFERRALQRGDVVAAGADAGTGARILVGCGGGLDGHELAIVDPDAGTRCGEGRVGEIWVAGPSVAVGYWRNPERTRELLQARLPGDERLYLRTGDLGFQRDGELFLVGRLKDVIIVGGLNHYAEDMEAVVAGAHPALRPGCAAAFAIDAEEGDGVQESVALVHEIYPGREGEAEGIFAAIREVVRAHHDVELHAIVLAAPGAVPKTSSGKVRRGACRAELQARTLPVVAEWTRPRPGEAPRHQRSAAEGSAGAPADVAAIEAWLLRHLAGRRGLDPADVDPREPFSRFGLASLAALRMVAELEAWLGRRLAPGLLWEQPNIRALAEHLAGADGAGDAAGVARGRGPAHQDAAHAVREPIAIVGMSCRFPGAPGIDAFWRLLREGRDAVTEIPAERWDANALYDPDPTAAGKSLSRWGGFLPDLDRFDAEFFRIAPREAPHVDPRQRLALELAWEAFEDAGIPPETLAGSRTAVFMATLTSDYDKMLSGAPQQIDAYTGPGTATALVANRISYVFDLHGPSLALDTACSGSLVALHLACQSLWSGESAAALAGGVSVNLCPTGDLFFSKAGALSPHGRCRSFDAEARGIVRSEGAGMVLLKPLSKALADGDPVHALIRGVAVNQDGRSNGILAPNGQAQQALLREAYRQAGVVPAAIRYVEAHGTGTPLGDSIEVRALGSVLGEMPREAPCALGSVKSNIGHMEPAAGIAGVIKTALALEHDLIPATIHCERPSPLLGLEALPLRVQQREGPWPEGPGPRLAGVSGFGIGGTNAHVVLEEAPAAAARAAHKPAAPREGETDAAVLVLSARTTAALQELARTTAEFLRERGSEFGLNEVCGTAAARRSALEERLAVAGRSAGELAARLDAWSSGDESAPVRRGRKPAAGSERLAFVFSGQGSQWPGMGLDLMPREPVFREALEAVDALVRAQAGWSVLAELQAPAPESRLDRTDVRQVTVFAVQVSLAALWRAWGVEPAAVIGQSVGEVAAAHVCGALSLPDAVRVIVSRSRLMSELAGRGKTALVGLSFEQARRAVATLEPHVCAAASVTPHSSLVSGEPEALARALEPLARDGVFHRLLPSLDVAMHSPQMDPLVPRLRAELAAIAPRDGAIPFFSSVAARVVRGAALDAAYWGRNLRDPFQFGAAVTAAAQDEGHTAFLEVSPHPMVTEAIAQNLTAAGVEGLVLASLRRGEPGRGALLDALGRLHVRGFPVAWERIYGRTQVVPLPHYPWQRERHWVDVSATVPAGRAERPAPGAAPEAGHPLMGRHCDASAAAGVHVWERELTASSQAYLGEHQVLDQTVLPGACSVEMTLRAAEAALAGAGVELEDVAFHRALVLSDEPRRVQVVLRLEAPDRGRVDVWSPLSGSTAGARWEHIASARAHAREAADAPPRIDLVALRGRCADEVSAARLYQRLEAGGVHYGGRFRTVERAWRGAGEALARVRLSHGWEAEAASYRIHPALLDGCLHAVEAASGTADAPGGLVLPVGLRRVVFHRTAGASLWCHARLRRHGAAEDDVVADLVLADEAGSVVAEIEGVRLHRIARRPADLHTDLYRVEWQPAAARRGRAPVHTQDAPGRWLILADRGGVGAALAERFSRAGAAATLVHGGTVGVASAVADALADPRPLAGVVYLRGLDTPQGTRRSGERKLAWQVERGMDLIQVVGALGRGNGQRETGSARAPRVWIATCRAQPVRGGPDAGLATAASALWGVSRGIAVEHPSLWGGIVDLEMAAPAEAAALLHEEIVGPEGEDQVGFRDGRRYVPRLVPRAPSPPSGLKLRPDATYLVTGGLGSLGLEIAAELVQRGARRLVLLGATPMPPRTRWAGLDPASQTFRRAAAIQRLEAAGACVRWAAVDVANRTQLHGFLRKYRREGWPPIRGVVHAAGVLRSGLMTRLSAEELQAVLAPKVVGASLLCEALQDAPLDFFVLFSSVLALLGAPGLVNYAAANAFLDAFAHACRGRGLPALSINWGPWAEVGMARRSGAIESQLEGGVRPFTIPEGRALFAELLGDAASQVVAVSSDWRAGRPDRLLAGVAAAPPPDAPAAPSDLTAALERSGPEGRGALVESYLAEEVARALRGGASRVDPTRPLTELGLDSIMSVEISTRFERATGMGLGAAELVMGQSLRQVAARIVAHWENAGVVAEGAAVAAAAEAAHTRGRQPAEA